MNHEKIELPNQLLPFVWHYLKHKKGCLAGFLLVSLVWAINMSVSPYLLKIIIDTVVQYANDRSTLFTAISLPIVFYVLMTIILNITSASPLDPA